MSLLILLFSVTYAYPKCYIPSDNPKEFFLDESNRAENKYRDLSTLPTSLDWRWTNGQRYTTWTRNQHIPNYCGSCWAFAVTSALSDRIMIQQNNSFPEWDLSPQVLLDCDLTNNGCKGGDTGDAYEYIRKYGITSETCAPYTATGHDTGNLCNNEARCKNCHHSNIVGCDAQYPHQVWYIKEHGNCNGEQAMIQALQDGPIVCSMAVTQQFENYRGFAIFNDTTGDVTLTHAISIVGYGTDNNIDYWIGRNSWSTWWGNNGYFRIIRGTNNLGIETSCAWATPADAPIWKNHSNSQPIKNKNEAIKRLTPKSKFMGNGGKPCAFKSDWKKIPPKITSPLPHTYIDVNALPNKFVWNNVNGTNYASLARNQHIPQYCGSCWGMGSLSSLNDRLSIQRSKNGGSIWPEITLSVQVLINENGGGTCNGGNAPGVMRYIERNGIPDETCQAYQAKNNPHGKNSNLNICENCIPGNSSSTFTPGTCSKVNNFTLYYVTQYGPVSGVNNMKSEIYARGPIACGIDATSQFEKYTGGVYTQSGRNLNHEISVLGWGVTDDGEAYWIGRNSWGTYWGEEGFFRIKMGSDNLGIETDCTWGVMKMP
eukprot:463518_1